MNKEKVEKFWDWFWLGALVVVATAIIIASYNI